MRRHHSASAGDDNLPGQPISYRCRFRSWEFSVTPPRLFQGAFMVCEKGLLKRNRCFTFWGAFPRTRDHPVRARTSHDLEVVSGPGTSCFHGVCWCPADVCQALLQQTRGWRTCRQSSAASLRLERMVALRLSRVRNQCRCLRGGRSGLDHASASLRSAAAIRFARLRADVFPRCSQCRYIRVVM